MAARKILEVTKGPYLAKAFFNKSSGLGYVMVYRKKICVWELKPTGMTRPEVEKTAGYMLRHAYEALA